MSNDSGLAEIYALPYPVGSAGRQTITTDTGVVPVWPRESDELVYQAGNDFVLRTMGITTEPTLTRSNPDELVNLQVIGARTTGGGTPLYDVTPDGERLLWSIPEDVAAVEEDGETPRINIVLNWFEELKDRLPVD